MIIERVTAAHLNAKLGIRKCATSKAALITCWKWVMLLSRSHGRAGSGGTWAPGPGVLVLLPPVARSLMCSAVMPSSCARQQQAAVIHEVLGEGARVAQLAAPPQTQKRARSAPAVIRTATQTS